MTFINAFARRKQEEILAKLEEIMGEKDLKKIILEETDLEAEYKGLTLSDENNRTDELAVDAYMFVLEYLQSIGLKMTPEVLRYESQNPQILVSREDLAIKYSLRSFDRTPLLTQLICEMVNFAESD